MTKFSEFGFNAISFLNMKSCDPCSLHCPYSLSDKVVSEGRNLTKTVNSLVTRIINSHS